jgi:hypothetical protein
MRFISYTLTYTSTGRGDSFNILGKSFDNQASRSTPPLPSNLAGINLEGRKYSNFNPPPISRISQKVSMVFQNIGLFVRERFSRYSKPVDHMGGTSPEGRVLQYELLSVNDINRDMEIWPKVGTTFEDMDIIVH